MDPGHAENHSEDVALVKSKIKELLAAQLERDCSQLESQQSKALETLETEFSRIVGELHAENYTSDALKEELDELESQMRKN